MIKALVLGGGGSKGAYEMGAWKALKELGLEFDIVTGTSIGALNGAMVVQGDYDACLDLWNTTRNDKIMTKPITFDDSSLKLTLKKMEDLIPFVRSYLQQRGVDITPFKRMMHKYIQPDKIRASKIKFGAVAVTFPGFKPIFIDFSQVKDEEIISYILASCSCFPLFPVCKVGEQSLIDGGYYDNLPINLALELGADEVVAIDLNYQITHPELLNKPFVKYIYPSWSLGGFFNFEEKLINQNMQLGYNDTMKAFGRYLGFKYSFYKSKLPNELVHSFSLEIAFLMKLFERSKVKSLAKDGFDSNLFKILENTTNRPLNYEEYYIRALEIALEFFDFDYLTVYQLSDIRSSLTNAIFNIYLTNMDLVTEYKNLKNKAKKRDYIMKTSREEILAVASQSILNRRYLDEELLYDIMAIYPELIIILALLKIWSETDAKEEKDFGFEFTFES